MAVLRFGVGLLVAATVAGFLPSAAIVSVSLGILAVTSLVVDLAAIAAVELWTGAPSS